jgi:predicted MFS family arabinose efflux permease
MHAYCSMLCSLIAIHKICVLLLRRFGRKMFILAAAALILTANVLQIAASGRAMLFAGRLIMGIGQGFATFTVPM